MKQLEKNSEYLIFLLGLILFVPFLGNVHLFDWDEINFAEASREMILSGNYSIVQIDYSPFWEKPPLFFWLQAISMKIFGINEFASRFPNAICGALTLAIIFKLGKNLFNYKFGIFWVITFSCSILPFFYFKSGIIDPWFNLFIFLSIWHLYLYLNKHINQLTQIILSAVFLGLAVLTKGPVAILIMGLCYGMFLLFNKFKNLPPIKHILLYIIVVIGIGGIWFFALIVNGNKEVIAEFIYYQIRLFQTQDAGHGGPFYYHIIILLIGCFPASFFAISMLKKDKSYTPLQQSFHFWMLLLFWIVLVLFSVVKTKIVHYSSLCYFPLTFFAALYIYKIFYLEKKLSRVLIFGTGTIGIFISVIMIAIPSIEKIKPYLLEKNIPGDEFGKQALMAEVNWNGLEGIGGWILLFGVCLFLYLQSKNSQKAILVLFLSSLISVSLAVTLITPKVESYSQGAAIEFYKSKRNENCFIQPLGFKSYAHLFYGQKKPSINPSNYTEDWLLNGNTDLPVYLVIKINRKTEYENYYPQLKELYKKNGFVFYKKEL